MGVGIKKVSTPTLALPRARGRGIGILKPNGLSEIKIEAI